MSEIIKVPQVGESITEVTIGQWSVEDGDMVEMDQIICELESDKATFELNAESAGKIKIIAQEGDTLAVGDTICEIDTDASASDSKSSSEDSQKESKSVEETKSQSSTANTSNKSGEIKEMRVSPVGESINEVTVGSWLKEDGDFVELDEIICEIESDKATFELPAEASGYLKHVASEGDTLAIGDLICKIEVAESNAVESVKEESQPQSTSHDNTSSSSKVSDADGYAAGHASPAAAKILKEKGINPSDVKGTGVDGRITKEDAQAAKKSDSKQTQAKESTSKLSEKSSGTRNQERKRMSNLRKTIAKRLVSVKNDTAMLTTFNEVNMKPIMELRKKYKESFKEKYEIGLGFMSFFTKACCMALQEYPAVNGQIDGDEIVYSDYCDVSIAVSTPRGLVVPVIRNAEDMSFDQIEKEIYNLAVKARDGKLSIEEMTGGTFTITNGGIFGSMLSTPIINAPQSAILGMHNIVERPMAVNGEVQILPIMYVALSYDHRIIDGKESVSFLVRVKELLEDPTRLLLGV
ncbi:2-oxoglutarate dehydrogenase complex dihydrolipoyllysine-residue succinyltransferase [Hyphobacterium sp. CCMP332]|nr:2-oxoglutarate dehydrogenase complex dihydrolipoyllysine-residue succinyltransferase [Hyphobacterium sp. CCMP332]